MRNGDLALFWPPLPQRNLRDVASRFGLDAVVARADVQDLTRRSIPAVALMDSERRKGSHFVPVCGVSPGGVDYFDGTYATWVKDDVEA